MSPYVFGILGCLLSYGIGSLVFGLGNAEIALSILVSNIAGLIALLGTLALERQPMIREHFMNRSIKTWSVMISLYLTILLGLVPALRFPSVVIGMFFPLLFSLGFMIPIFGPIQDRIVRRAQQRSKLMAPSRSNA